MGAPRPGTGERLAVAQRAAFHAHAAGTSRSARPLPPGTGGSRLDVVQQTGQVRIEHVTLHAVAGQTIAAGGGTVQWDQIAPPPTERRGFSKITLPVGDIPIDVTGRLIIHLGWRWETFRCKGDLTITRTRDDVETTRTYDLGAIRSTEPAPATLPGWEVRAGDTITIQLPNDSGEGQALAEAEIVLDITEIAASTSTLLAAQEETSYALGLHSVEVPVPTAARPGDLLVAMVWSHEDNITSPSGWTRHETTGIVNSDVRAALDARVMQAGDESFTWNVSGGSEVSRSVSVLIVAISTGTVIADTNAHIEAAGTDRTLNVAPAAASSHLVYIGAASSDGDPVMTWDGTESFTASHTAPMGDVLGSHWMTVWIEPITGTTVVGRTVSLESASLLGVTALAVSDA